VNADGVGDLIIGAPGIQPSFVGKAYVVFGNRGGFPPAFMLASLNPDGGGDGSAGFVAVGIDTADMTGRCVSGVGDVNDDGVDDIVISATGRESGDDTWVGASYVIFGRTTGFPALLPLATLDPAGGGDGSEGFVLLGRNALDQAGESVSAAGDVNADGIDDLLIGAPFADRRAGLEIGESYVLVRPPRALPGALRAGNARSPRGRGWKLGLHHCRHRCRGPGGPPPGRRRRSERGRHR
jgi:hypothetical protein